MDVRSIVAVLAVSAIVACPISAQSPSGHPQDNSVTIGRELYQVQCAYCHGAEGKGDGEASHLLFPRPRDLTAGLFTLRSTPKGSPPTDNDLLRTLARGIPGAGFSFLKEPDRKALVAYVKTMSPIFSSASPKETQALSLNAQPALSAEVVAAGKAVYEKAHCGSCHGAEGKGDGEGARDLEDDAGFPIKVRNFTTGPFKGGTSVGDIYLRIATGMDGTPMRVRPGLSETERWQLAYYVKSLCQAKSCDAIPDSGLLMSARTKRKLPLDDPFAAAWKAAPTLQAPLNSLWNRGMVAPDLVVRSLNDGRMVAFLLEWSDSTKNASTVLPQDFSDAVALQFFSGQGNATLAMGDNNTEVTIWQWKADWQEQIDRGRRAGPGDAHPWMVDEGYPVPGAAAVEAGNPIALAHRHTPAEEATARGFGAISPKPLNAQLVSGKGVWRDGRWHVVLSRTLAAESDIKTDGQTRIGFAVWNGSEGDRAGQKAISTWYTLMLERK
jgi:cytochrome c